MTDNEIIKSMDACVIGNCEGCVYTSVEECGCRDALIIGLSNVINRKDARILELQGNLKFVRGTVERLLETIDNRQKAEIDRFADIGKMYSEVRADTAKKFAELLKANRGLYGEIWDEDIDNIVKEMTEAM